ncbi:PD-(D/E)XK nuclease family protein [Pseudescherichia sp.]|uniref:PDDEXK-like family protein n=1 Tax=Pseudescherichia sp. TaxID=2055881 RepID=UPI002897CF0C|nr:PD-(D/E)XK nuclease family protein [Pseudescherichia sp.]
MEQSPTSLAAWLPHFFAQWPRQALDTQPKALPTVAVDALQLSAFMAELEQPLAALRHGTFNFDPWEVAKLGRNEMRNSAVLAWLLDPHGNHGFGDLPLKALLGAVRECGNNRIPENFTRYCRVSVEKYPTGDATNRVDIEIDADNFFMLIEVKIGAYEQKDQISRYIGEAKKRAGGHPWAVVYLTPQGRVPLSAGEEADVTDVPCLSWRRLASVMTQAMEPTRRQIFAAAEISPARQIAAHAAFCFLDRMRQF